MKWIRDFNYLFVFFLIFTIPFRADPQLHPDTRWKEIRNEILIVVYPEHYDQIAIKTLQTSSRIYQKIKSLFQSQLKERIRILVSDGSDTFSTSSAVFPFPHIAINLAHPGPDRLYGSFKNPYTFFLTKEMCKVFMNKFRGGPINYLRNIFGNHPLLYGMLLAPRTFIEGFSTYFALVVSVHKEKMASELSLILRKIANSKKFPTLSKIKGNYQNWPTKFSRFVFGSGFIHFLGQNYTVQTLVKLIKSYTTHPIKYSSNRRIENFLKSDIKTLWTRFYLNCQKNEFINTVKGMKTIDDSGMIQRHPMYISDNQFIYLKNNFKEPKHILFSKGQKRTINSNYISGISYDKQSENIYYSATITTDPYLNYSDIFVLHSGSKQVRQLSFGARLFDPVRIPNQDALLCVKRERNHAFLTRFDLNTRRSTVISDGLAAISHPVISPDNQFIAAAIKHQNRYWQIALFHSDGRLLRYISSGRMNCFYPKWRKKGELIFIRESPEKSRLSFFRIDDKPCRYESVLEIQYIKYFSLSEDGNRFLITYLSQNGYNTSEFPFESVFDSSLPIDEEQEINTVGHGSKEETHFYQNKKRQVRRYNYIRDLLPKYFSPTLNYAGNELQPGISTSGGDILNKNLYEINLLYGLKKKQIFYDLKYKFNGFFQNLKLNMFDRYSLNRSRQGSEFLFRTIGIQLLLSHPFFKTRKHTASFAFDLHYEKNISESEFDETSASFQNRFIQHYNGFGFSLLYRSTKEYYNSFSKNDGFSLALTYSKDLKRFGSNFDSKTVFFEYKHYIPIFRPNVLSFRLAVIKSWGENERRIFMGGAETVTTSDPQKHKFFGLMRGYPSGFFMGTTGYLLNTEYRISLKRIEDSILILPYIERLYLTLFADIGELLLKKNFTKPSVSLGAEFNVKFNFKTPLTLSCGIAKGKNPRHNWIYYIRVENAF